MSIELVESFSQMVREKGIDKDHLAVIIEEIFGILVKKRFGENARYNVVFNTDKGEIEIFLSREIVDVITEEFGQITIDEVNDKGNEDELEVGDDYVEKLQLAIFGRRLITFAKQSLNQRIRELEKEIIFKEYKQIEGEIVIGDVYQINKTNILVNHNKNQLVLPKEEQIPSEKPKKGDTLRAIVKEVGKGNKGPEIIISRASNEFLKKLFEIEVPEIYDGIIDIKGIARKPGERAKLAVSSQDKRIDPVGACIGMKGVRVTAIVRELNNENIDVVHYSDDPKVYVQRALLPGKIKKIEINAQANKAIVFADADQAAQIVGRGGVNITLASQLTGYEIEFIREEKTVDEYEEDIELIDLRSELGEATYNVLINNRFDSALEVLRAGKVKLAAIEELSNEDVDRILALIQSELEEE
jgi:N utilization substance protein A